MWWQSLIFSSHFSSFSDPSEDQNPNKPYINGKLIYSAIRWCINFNFEKLILMTGFVVHGHIYLDLCYTNKAKTRNGNKKVQVQSHGTFIVNTIEGVWRSAITSWKLCWVNLSAIRSSSLQEWVSAKALMPKQFEGSNCRFRNSQQASWISASCNKQAAGSKVCTFPSSTVTCRPPHNLRQLV